MAKNLQSYSVKLRFVIDYLGSTSLSTGKPQNFYNFAIYWNKFQTPYNFNLWNVPQNNLTFAILRQFWYKHVNVAKVRFYCNIPAGGLAFPDNWGELLYFVAPGPSFSIWTTVKVVDFRIILSPTRHKFQCATAVIFWHTGFFQVQKFDFWKMMKIISAWTRKLGKF